MASTLLASSTGARSLADAETAAFAAFCLRKPFATDPMHLSEPGQYGHEDQKENDNLGDHGLQAKLGKSSAFFHALKRIIDHPRTKARQQTAFHPICSEFNLFAEAFDHHRFEMTNTINQA